ncbi:MAG TPA: hypothetical protein VHB21_14375, partial [Minicystis sp.]|nr:hypothetical protein [Minicystis sp.]
TSSFVALACFAAAIAGCSGAPPPAPETAVVVAPPATPAPPTAPAFPAEVKDLAAVVPRDAPYVIELPEADVVADKLPADQRIGMRLALPFVVKAVADEVKVDPDALSACVDAFSTAIVFGDVKVAAIVARFTEREPVERLLASFEAVPAESSPPTRAVFKVPKRGDVRLAWFAAPRLLVFAAKASGIDDVERAATGAVPAFTSAPARLPPDPAAVHAYLDLAAIARDVPNLRGLVDAGSRARLDAGFGPHGLRSKLELTLVGPRVPRLASVFDASAPKLAARAPEETFAFGSMSLARKPGKTLRDVVSELGRVGGAQGGAAAEIDATIRPRLGVDLDDLETLLGGELTAGAVSDPRAASDATLWQGKGMGPFAGFAAVSTRDDGRARRLFAGITKLVKQKVAAGDYKVTAAASSIRLDPKHDGDPPMRVALHPGALAFEIGAAPWMDRIDRAFDKGERPLGPTTPYRASAAGLERPANAMLWTDPARLPKKVQFAGAGGAPGLARLTLTPSDAGLQMTFEGENGAEIAVVGAASAVAVYGVRRYLANAKTAEARSMVRAMARAAVTAYERESLGPKGTTVHRLCKSAPPVPKSVPKGVQYGPASGAGSDYETGDEFVGWRCLKFQMGVPQYYQYEYRQGGPYKGAKRGGPDPGADGFEVSAEGDLDGNGKTSLFTMTGKIDRAKHRLVLSPTMFVADEYE